MKHRTYWAVVDTTGLDKGDEIIRVFALGTEPYRIFSTRKEARQWKTDPSDKIIQVHIIPVQRTKERK